jgi:hypothetical protein
MKVFMAFMLICFVGTILLRKHDLKTSVYILYALALLVSFGYFFFNQI